MTLDTQRPDQRRLPTRSPRPHQPQAGSGQLADGARHAGRRRRRVPRLVKLLGVPLLLGALVTAGSPGFHHYTIRRGDTLSEIALRYHTTVAKLIQVNHLPGNGNLIYAGESLRIPRHHTAHASGGHWTTVRRHHLVVSGDTLYGIAKHYGVSPSVIVRANHIPSSLVVRLGDTLVVPVRVHRAAKRDNTFAGRTYSSSLVRTAAHNRAILAHRRLPSQAQMHDLIVQVARANHVDPALALAVSWQEAGWSMRQVSVANAIGAMQVIPSTGDWISSVVGRRLNLLNPHDNVIAGVVLLRVLDQAAGERNAIAGYYQGLASVRAHGMFADTRHYVANVLALKARFS